MLLYIGSVTYLALTPIFNSRLEVMHTLIHLLITFFFFESTILIPEDSAMCSWSRKYANMSHVRVGGMAKAEFRRQGRTRERCATGTRTFQ